MDREKIIKFWSQYLKIPKEKFIKPYIKKTKLNNVKHNKGGFGYGTCNLRICNSRLAEKIMMSIKAISDQYTK